MSQLNGAVAAAIVEQSPDAIILAGKDGVIQLWNAAAAAIFGFTEAEALGQNLDIIIPEALRAAHWKGFDEAIERGDTKHHGKALPTKAINARGEAFYVELSFGIVKDETGAVIGALAHGRDITERFEQDKLARRRLRELEQELKALKGEG